MVSTQKYLSTFCEIMPVRLEMIQKALANKDVLDAEFQKAPRQSDMQKKLASRLMSAIGEDLSFNSAAAKSGMPQSLRYYLLKSKGSLYFLIKSMSDELKNADAATKVAKEQLKSRGIDLDSILTKFITLSDRALKRYNDVDHSLVSQYLLLRDGNFGDYYVLSRKEMQFRTSLSDIFGEFKGELSKFVERIKDFHFDANTDPYKRNDSLAFGYNMVLIAGVVAGLALAFSGEVVLGGIWLLLIAGLRNQVLKSNPSLESRKLTQLLEGVSWQD